MPKVPVNLTHQPVYIINDYAAVDGNYKNNTDVAGISIGKAQWSKSGFIPSIKVWRYKNRWSRQSEETTLTRALDMATMIIRVLDKHYNRQSFKSVQTIFGELKIENNSKADPAVIAALEAFLIANKGDITAHVDMLYDALKAYKENMAASTGKTVIYTP